MIASAAVSAARLFLKAFGATSIFITGHNSINDKYKSSQDHKFPSNKK
jgi:hypothetical protein